MGFWLFWTTFYPTYFVFWSRTWGVVGGGEFCEILRKIVCVFVQIYTIVYMICIHRITSSCILVIEHSLCVWEVRVRFPAESNQAVQIGS